MAEPANQHAEVNNQEQQNGEFFAGALLGAMAGGLAALLMTPKNGAEMRRLMAEYFKEWEAEAEVFAEDIKEMTETFRRVLEEQEGVSSESLAPQPRTTSQWFADTAAQATQTLGQAKDSVGDVVESLRQEWRGPAGDESQPAPDLYINLRTQPSDAQVKMGATEAFRSSGHAAAVAEPEPEPMQPIAPSMTVVNEPRPEEPVEVEQPVATPPEMEEPAFMRAARKEEESVVAPERSSLSTESESKPDVQEQRPNPMDQATMAWSGHRPSRRQGSYNFSMHAAASSTFDERVAEPSERLADKDQSVITKVESEFRMPKTAEPEPTLFNSVEEVKKEVELKPTAKAATETKPAYQKRVLSSTKTVDVPVEPITSIKPIPDKPRTKKLFFKKK